MNTLDVLMEELNTIEERWQREVGNGLAKEMKDAVDDMIKLSKLDFNKFTQWEKVRVIEAIGKFDGEIYPLIEKYGI